MFILGNFCIALSRVIDIALTILYWLILIHVVLSWVNPDPFNPIVRFVRGIIEPILQPVRRFLPWGPIDFSPLIAFFIILFMKWFLVTTLFDLGLRLK